MDYQNIIDSYITWIKDNTSLRMIKSNNICEVTTPFLDRHNDNLQIYAFKKNNQIVLSDGGYILNDLRTSGFILNTPKRQKLFDTTLNGFGVKLDDKEHLVVEANLSNLGQKKHNLLQAIISVNDLYTLSQESVYSLFKEDVEKFFKSENIYYSKDIKLAGKTGFDHNIDFLIPSSKQKPERLIRVVNNAKKDMVMTIIFAFNDILANREAPSSNYVIYNDFEYPVSADVGTALKSYNIRGIPFTSRKEHLSEFLLVN